MSKNVTIDSTLWKKSTGIVDLENVDLDKLKIVGADNDIEYKDGGFWLSFTDLKGFFKWRGKTGYLELFLNKKSEKLYDAVWDKLSDLLGIDIDSEISSIVRKYGKEFIVYDNAFPFNSFLLIDKITIVIKSLFKHKNLFYPQISLHFCSYKEDK